MTNETVLVIEDNEMNMKLVRSLLQIGKYSILEAIVALTSYAIQGDEKKAIDTGCAGYMAKPIDTRSFLETVGHFLV